MNRALACLVIATGLVALTGCTGLTQGENKPGSSVWLEDGSIAVDQQTETTFLLQKRTKTSADQSTTSLYSALLAVDPDDGDVSQVASWVDRTDARILFPDAGIMIMSEHNLQDRLELRDRDSFTLLKSRDLSIRYHGTRMSPSRDYVAVADNTSDHSPIHIIDAATLESNILPHNGDWLEAMWLNGSDELVAIVFYDQGPEGPYARIMSWTMDVLRAANFLPDETGFCPNHKIDVTIPMVKGDMFFSYTWVGVSPDDATLAFPVRLVDDAEASHAVLVMDRESQSVGVIKHAKGPVGFTPDSKTIVSYADAPTVEGEPVSQDLWLINAETLEVDEQPVPIEGGISYFVSHEGNFIVVSSANGNSKLLLYDVDQEQQTQMSGDSVDLLEFVTRVGHAQMWLTDNQTLYRLDLNEGTFDEIRTRFAPEHINILPQRDRLVMDDASSPKLYFFNPEQLSVELTATLPQP